MSGEEQLCRFGGSVRMFYPLPSANPCLFGLLAHVFCNRSASSAWGQIHLTLGANIDPRVRCRSPISQLIGFWSKTFALAPFPLVFGPSEHLLTAVPTS